jgi:hypothetical protein
MKYVIFQNLHDGTEKIHVKLVGLLAMICTREPPYIKPVCYPFNGDANTHVRRPCVSLLYIYVVRGCYFAFWDMSNTRLLDQGNFSSYNNVLDQEVYSEPKTCSKGNAQLSLCTPSTCKGPSMDKFTQC